MMSNMKDVNEFLSDAEFYQQNHLAVAAAYCRKINLIETVDKLAPSNSKLSTGTVVQAMVLDTLSGRSPLYRLNEFLDGQDVELLLGKDIPSSDFNDTALGRSLDRIYETGASKIITELGMQAVSTFELDTKNVSYDTTSTNVWGDYLGSTEELDGPIITHGYSKDHRPDLKQFMTELLCVEGGVPIHGKSLDGNSSDKNSNNEMLTNISKIMSTNGIGAGAFIYVADSAFVTKSNLKEVGDNLFVSRLPATYNESKRVIREGIENGNWINIGETSKTKGSAARPSAFYKYQEMTVSLHGSAYRAVVIHSSSHDKRREKKLQRDIKASEKLVKTKMKKQILNYSCEEDANAFKKSILKYGTELHSIKANVEMIETRKPGRAPAGKDAPTKVTYNVKWTTVLNTSEVEMLKKIAGCFVLLSNVPLDGEMALDGAEILKTYKGQHAVERDFSFLKDPLVVNDTFLKLPHRIEALGMVLIISLMVYRIMERSMRVHLENNKATLPGWDNKKTSSPTSFMMSTKIRDVFVIRAKDGTRYIQKKPSEIAMLFLEALGLDATVFVDPKSQCNTIIPKKKE